MTLLPNFNKALPRCEGPKLHPFHDRKAVVTFLRLLSEVDSKGHAHVFEVLIGSENYALKVFKFYDDDEDRAGLVGEENDLVPDDLLHAHMDPFYNECRAYGRFAETHQDGKIAVRCYGHLSIPAAREDELERKFRVEDWDRPDKEYATPVAKRQPLRAIVKELVREDVPLTQRVVKKMLKDLKKMRDLGVYPLDVRARNYRAGRLLDMSVAITEPHYLFDIRPGWQIRSLKREDRKERRVKDFDHLLKGIPPICDHDMLSPDHGQLRCHVRFVSFVMPALCICGVCHQFSRSEDYEYQDKSKLPTPASAMLVAMSSVMNRIL